MDNPSDDSVKYKKGEMSPQQMHAFEKRALSDPFLAEALEGIENISDQELSKDVSAINETVLGKKKVIIFTPLRIAAGLALLVSSIFLVYQFTPQPEMLALKTEKQKPEAKKNESPQSESKATETEIVKQKAATGIASIKNQKPKVDDQKQPALNRPLDAPAPLQEIVSAEPQQVKADLREEEKQTDLAKGQVQNSGEQGVINEKKKESFSKSETSNSRAAKRLKKDAPLGKGEMTDVAADKNGETVLGPSPLGGRQAFDKYLKDNLHYPTDALKNKIGGAVVIQFNVRPDGSTENFVVAKSIGYGCDEEAVRLVKEGPKWIAVVEGSKPGLNKTQVKIIFDHSEANR